MRTGASASVTVAENVANKRNAQDTASTPRGRRTKNQAESTSVQARAGLLTAQVQQLPEIRQDRVTAIANAIRNGTYHVSPEQTAEAILSERRAAGVAA
jgi:flagellar biosynthesis anti-sigma factor FlgM